MSAKRSTKEIGIIVDAGGSSTLGRVLDRIPQGVRAHVALVGGGQEQLDEVRLERQSPRPDQPLTVVGEGADLGPGGNQKAAFRWAIEQGLDIVVVIPRNGEHTPEYLEELLAPLERGDCGAVIGSRMLDRGSARAGGMPSYEYYGNRALSRLQNRIAGLELSDWYSGYRAYRVDALRSIPFESNPNGLGFDTGIIVQLHEANQKVAEVPVASFCDGNLGYGDASRYGWEALRQVVRYRIHKIGFGSGTSAFATPGYELKTNPDSSHARILDAMRQRPPGRVLDLGCSDGALSAQLRKLGHEVTGVDLEELPGVGDSVDLFFFADLDAGIPAEVGDGYDVAIAADVLEHVRWPDHLLEDIGRRLAPDGLVLASIPSFSHWYPRLRTVAGLFDYDRRGILDSGHFRFFTFHSFKRLVEKSGFSVVGYEALGLPLEVVDRGSSASGSKISGVSVLQRLNRLSVRLWPSLFAYQYLFKLSMRPSQDS